MKKLLVLLLLLIIFLIGCQKQNIAREDITLQTKDGIKIAATVLYGSDKSVIFAHMLDHDRTDWDILAKKFNDKGFTTISIDLRGHGKSGGDWKQFSEEDFNGMVYDIKAAKEFLDEKGKDSVSIVGASIGANAAVKYAASDKEIKSVVLLSPGINYKGISIEDDITDFKTPILIIVSKNDAYPYESSNIIYEKVSGKKELIVEENLGHGSDMLPKSQEMQDKIIKFISSYE
jgi:esterase/lipase